MDFFADRGPLMTTRRILVQAGGTLVLIAALAACGGGSGRSVAASGRRAGRAVRITYRPQSPATPVTGKTTRDEVERYEFWKAGNEAILTLSGPVGADNVDPWRLVTDSLRWQR